MVALSVAMAPFSYATDEVRLSGAEILEILANRRVVGKDFEQTFGDPREHMDASTTYWQGNNSSFGRWKVVDDQYCSLWPQSSLEWSCYTVARLQKGVQVFVIWTAGSQRFEGLVTKR